MHPLLAGPNRRFLLYLAGWIPTAALLVALLNWNGSPALGESIAVVAPLVVVFAFVCLSPWYLCRRLPLDAAPVWRILTQHSAASILASLFWIAVAQGIAVVLSRFFPGLPDRLRPHLLTLFGVGILLYELSVALHYAALAIQASRQAELMARDAELRALKAQINPHFLFNSLNSISALTAVDPARAREMCIRLSEFLRSTLGLGDKTSISLGEELALIKIYLDIEQVRFGARLRVEREIQPGCEGFEIPPLLLQPLVENAVKHGVASMPEGGCIRLEARQNEGPLVVSVENDFDPEAPSRRHSGVGLPNVQRRLRTRYGTEARLDVHVDRNRYRVELRFPAPGGFYKPREIPVP